MQQVKANGRVNSHFTIKMDSILEEIPLDLASDFYHRLEFTKSSTEAIAITPHGTALAIGYKNGDLIVYDTYSFSSKYTFEGHKNSITDISFSRDSRFIASGDSQGIFIIHTVLDRNIVFQKKFDKPIAQVQFSPVDLNIILIRMKTGQILLFNRSNEEIKEITGVFNCFAWVPCENNFCVVAKDIVTKMDPDFNQIEEYQLNSKIKRGFTSLVISQTKRFFGLVSTLGSAILYDADSRLVIEHFQDVVGRARYSSLIFVNKDEYVIITSKDVTSDSIIAKRIDNESDDKYFNGPREQIFATVTDPKNTTIYFLIKHGILEYRYSKYIHSMNSTPIPNLLKINTPYKEDEDEFDNVKDINDSESYSKFDFEALTEEEIIPTLPDDENYPDQITELPYIIDSDDENEKA